MGRLDVGGEFAEQLEHRRVAQLIERRPLEDERAAQERAGRRPSVDDLPPDVVVAPDDEAGLAVVAGAEHLDARAVALPQADPGVDVAVDDVLLDLRQQVPRVLGERRPGRPPEQLRGVGQRDLVDGLTDALREFPQERVRQVPYRRLREGEVLDDEEDVPVEPPAPPDREFVERVALVEDATGGVEPLLGGIVVHRYLLVVPPLHEAAERVER